MSAKAVDVRKLDPEPSVTLAGFRLWVFGRQCPHCTDYWDGNWVVVKAVCESMASRTKAQGSFVHLTELSAWLKELETLHRRGHGDAALTCMEPNLSAVVAQDKCGTGTFTVRLTPNHMTEQHQFVFRIDQSYLPPLIEQLTLVLREHPVRNSTV